MGSYRKYAHSWRYQTRRKRKGTFFVLFAIILSLIIFTVRFIIVLPYFYVRDVRIRGLKRLSPSQLTAKINIPPHTSIFTLNLDKIYKSIESQPMVKRVIIKKKLPSTLLIDVEERLPYAYIKIKEKFWEIDKEGIILRVAEGSLKDLPLIEGIDPVKDRKKLLNILNILKLCKLLNIKVDRIVVEKKDKGIVAYAGNIQIIIGKANYYRYLFYVPEIIEDAKKRKERLIYIDLRFNGQIVVLPKKIK